MTGNDLTDIVLGARLIEDGAESLVAAPDDAELLDNLLCYRMDPTETLLRLGATCKDGATKETGHAS
ncbi:MAG: hypothetical protein ABJQ23_20000 [Shimia thalassica]|uniref:hypothetical protein n=1 Tax=Shimia thalassica TaxID=1715693 RepID=UPI003297E731